MITLLVHYVLQACDACADMGMTYSVTVQCTDCVVLTIIMLPVLCTVISPDFGTYGCHAHLTNLHDRLVAPHKYPIIRYVCKATVVE